MKPWIEYTVLAVSALALAGIACLIGVSLHTNGKVESMVDREQKALIQKFCDEGVETMRYEGESIESALRRHIAAIEAKRQARGE